MKRDSRGRGRTLVVAPDGTGWAPWPRVDNAMVKALLWALATAPASEEFKFIHFPARLLNKQSAML